MKREESEERRISKWGSSLMRVGDRASKVKEA